MREARFIKGLQCPRCESAQVKRNGNFKDKKGVVKQRYLCKECGRTFNDLTGTPLAYSKKQNLWGKMATCMVEGLSVRKAAARLKVNKSTSFRWRHKLLSIRHSMAKPILGGIIEADETYFQESFKGMRRLQERLGRPPRKYFSKPFEPKPSAPRYGCMRTKNVMEVEVLMADLSGRENRIVDLSKVRDNRYNGAGFRVNENNTARCSAVFCEWIVSANTAHGGISPFPYGLYMLEGDAEEIQDLPEELHGVSFLEAIPCDRPDRRAARLIWNEAGTEATFSFAALASALGIEPPKGATLWFDAVPLDDTQGKPVAVLPLGDRIKRQAVHEAAAGEQTNTK